MKTCCVVPRRHVELSTQVKGALKVVLGFTLPIHVFSTLNLSFSAIIVKKKKWSLCVSLAAKLDDNILPNVWSGAFLVLVGSGIIRLKLVPRFLMCRLCFVWCSN